MRKLPFLFACLALSAASAGAQDAMKAGDAMKVDAMKGAPTKGDAMAKPMTIEECQAHMAMSRKDAKKRDAMVKQDLACSDMTKKDDAMMKPETAKK